MDNFLIDYSYAIHAFHNTNRLSAFVDGENVPTGGPFGLLRLIASIREKNPSARIFCCGDTEPRHRLEIDPEYKAGRTKTPKLWATASLTRQAAAKWNAPFVFANGWEADDVIYSMVARGVKAAPTDRYFVYTRDLDTIDLCDWERVFQGHSVIRGRLVPLSREEFVERHEHQPESRQVWKSMKGKPADNIKAVPRFKKEYARSIADAYMRDVDAFSMDVQNDCVRGAVEGAAAELKKHKDMIVRNCSLVAHRDVGPDMQLDRYDIDESNDALRKMGMLTLLG